jgi:RHS repeat-associated protein
MWNNSNWTGSPTNDLKFAYDGWNLVGILTNTTLLSSYVWGLDLSGSQQGAGGVGGLLWVSEVTDCFFTAFDGNGNEMALVDASDGTASAKYEYGPFGEAIRSTGQMAKSNKFRFSTKYHEEDVDLVYYGLRYYKPGAGFWLARDPIGEPEGANLYSFVRNIPIMLIDRYGLSPALPVNNPPPIKFECELCCCAQDIEISNIKRLPLPHWGNSFDATVNMSWVIGKHSECTLRWWEWAATESIPNMPTPGTWVNQMNFANTKNGLATLAPWANRAPGATQVVITDVPQIAIGDGKSYIRDLYIVIQLLNGDGCPCAKKTFREARVHQHATSLNGTGTGQPTLEAIDSMPNPPGNPPFFLTGSP